MKKLQWIGFCCVFLLLLVTDISSQSVLSRGFDTLSLGMSLDEAKEALENSRYFAYRGSPDLSLRPGTQEPIIRARGLGFVEEVYLQFSNERLYSLIVHINTENNDYLSFYNRFSGDYGRPAQLSPEFAQWEDSETRIRLDKPLRVLYLDVKTFGQMVEENRIEQASGAYSRDIFMDAF